MSPKNAKQESVAQTEGAAEQRELMSREGVPSVQRESPHPHAAMQASSRGNTFMEEGAVPSNNN